MRRNIGLLVILPLLLLATALQAEDKPAVKVSGTITKIDGANVTVQPAQLLKEKPPAVVVSTSEKTVVKGHGKELGMTLMDLKVGMEVQVSLDDTGKADTITVLKNGKAGPG